MSSKTGGGADGTVGKLSGGGGGGLSRAAMRRQKNKAKQQLAASASASSASSSGAGSSSGGGGGGGGGGAGKEQAAVPSPPAKRRKTAAEPPAPASAKAWAPAPPLCPVEHGAAAAAAAADGHTISLDASLDSGARAARLFEWMIAPLTRKQFYESYWEKRPLLIRREARRGYFDGWFSRAEMTRQLTEEQLAYGAEVDLTRYEYLDAKGKVCAGKEAAAHRAAGMSGVRKTLNPGGCADAATVWRHVDEAGCSARFVTPQRHSEPVWRLLAALQDEWGSMAAANAYYTPAAAQGFSPHFDDVEVFAMQLEGAKTWTLYAPPEEARELPRLPSRNFAQDELPPVYASVTLRPGDLLYFPRGWIHQCTCAAADPSLHLTVSCAHKNAHVDFLEELLPNAIARCAADGAQFRGGLPRNAHDFLGLAFAPPGEDDEDEAAVYADRAVRVQDGAGAGASSSSGASSGGASSSSSAAASADAMQEDEEDAGDDRSVLRRAFKATTHGLLQRIMAEATSAIDLAADKRARDFLHQSMPPPLLPEERAAVHPRLWAALGQEREGVASVPGPDRVSPYARVRLVRARCARLLLEDGDCVLYHSMANGRTLFENELQCLQFEPSDGQALEMLLTSYPDWVRVDTLPLKEIEDRVELVNALYYEGILMALPEKRRKGPQLGASVLDADGMAEEAEATAAAAAAAASADKEDEDAAE